MSSLNVLLIFLLLIARLNYVASFPWVNLRSINNQSGDEIYVDVFFFFDLYSATSTKYGIEEFGPPFFDGTYPDIVLAGPNVGSNTGVIDALSGTVYVLATFELFLFLGYLTACPKFIL